MIKNLRMPIKTRKDSNPHALKIAKALEKHPFLEISPQLLLKINARAKRMALRVDTHNRCVNLVIPPRASMRAAYHFALEHQSWIRQKIADLPDIIEYCHGTKINILGQKITIKITYDSTLKMTNILLKDNNLVVLTNKENPSKRIRRFLMDMALEKLTALSQEKAKLIRKNIKKVDVKDTKSRWGSCSSDGHLSYSWRLIFAPEYAFDYVVAHEVAHLKQMDHSPAFWHLCEDLSADYSRGKTWMKRYSQKLIEYA